jgi:hypothetical protein
MKIDTTRTVLEEMRARFTEVGPLILTEPKLLNRPVGSDQLMFRSYLSKNENLGEVLVSVSPDHGLDQLSLNFYGNVADSSLLELMILLKFMNFSSTGAYWTLTQNEEKIEFVKMFGVPAGKINREDFVSVLKKFLESGFGQYSHIRRLLQGHEKASGLIKELRRKMREQQKMTKQGRPDTLNYE